MTAAAPMPAKGNNSDFGRAWDAALNGIEVASERLLNARKRKLEQTPVPPEAPAPASTEGPLPPRTTRALRMTSLPTKETRMAFQALAEEQMQSSDELKREREKSDCTQGEVVNSLAEEEPKRAKSWIGRLLKG